jgi:hypothetical protein
MTTDNQEKTNIHEQLNFEEKYLKYKTKYMKLKESNDSQPGQPGQPGQTVQIGGVMSYNVYHKGGNLGEAKQACQRVMSGCNEWFQKMKEWSEYHDADGSDKESARREIDIMLDSMNSLFQKGNHEYRFFWKVGSWNLGAKWL